MLDPIWLGVLVVLIGITLVVAPKALKFENGRPDELLTSGLLKKQAGDFSEAQYLLKRALDAFENEKKPEFSKLCSCIVHLAECYEKSAHYAEARQLYEKLCSLWLSAISKDNPDVFLDIDYLAATADFGSGSNEIADCYGAIVEAKKQVFGPKHPDVANSLLIQSRLLARLGRKAEAEKLELEAKNSAH